MAWEEITIYHCTECGFETEDDCLDTCPECDAIQAPCPICEQPTGGNKICPDCYSKAKRLQEAGYTPEKIAAHRKDLIVPIRIALAIGNR